MGSIGPQFGVSPTMLKQRSLNSLAAEIGIQQIDVIKIDVEGAELGVLQGAAGIIGSKRPPVICSSSPIGLRPEIPDSNSAMLRLFCSGMGTACSDSQEVAKRERKLLRWCATVLA